MVAAMAGGLPGGMVPGAGSGPTAVAALQSSAGNQATGRLLAGAAPAPAPSTPSLTGSFGQVGDLVNDPALPDATAQVSAADPSSHIDWEKWWADPSNKLSVLRMPLEVLRAWPGPGLLFGAAADGVNIYQDFSQISGEEAPFLKAFMGLRSTLLVINNIIGHLVYIDQFVQDGLAVSVVGIEFTPLSAGLNGLLKLTKSYLDLCLLFIDFGLLCGAGYRASKAPPGSESAKNFAAMFGNYAANSMTDLVTFVIDVIDMVSGGVSNGEVIKSGVGAVNAILKGAIKLSPIIRSILIGWFGIFGGIPLTPKTSALTPEASTASAGTGSTSRGDSDHSRRAAFDEGLVPRRRRTAVDCRTDPVDHADPGSGGGHQGQRRERPVHRGPRCSEQRGGQARRGDRGVREHPGDIDHRG
jgi:hypothetical protein